MRTKFILLSIFIVATMYSCTNTESKSDAYGNFEASELTVSALGQGEIIRFNIEEGQKVRENQLVGFIDTSALNIQKQQLIAKIAAVNDKFLTLNSQIEIYRQQKENINISLERIQKLFQKQAATKQQLDDVNGKMKLVEKQIQALKVQKKNVASEIKVLYTQIDLINNSITKNKIRIPINGTIINKFVEQGEIAAPGKPLFKMADLNTMILKVYISGTQLSHVKLGQKVEVLIDENNKENKSIEGVITWISSKAEFTPKVIQTKEERVKQVYALKVKVNNDTGMLKIGMPGEIIF